MKLLADESVDRPIIDRLRHDGHDVASIAEESPGASDDDVLARAHASGVVLITTDKDFGELVFHQKLPHSGVLLLRLPGSTETEKCDLVSQVIANREADLGGAFSVLAKDVLRIRKPVDNSGNSKLP